MLGVMALSLPRGLEALSRAHRAPAALDGFVDALLQKFENCRAGLADAALAGGGADAYFRSLHESERERLRDAIRLEQPHLDEVAREAMFAQVERLVSGVLIPAYVRVAGRFTARERNGFYLAPEGLHGAERAGWAVAGVVAGALVVQAPFIPLWSKEWVFPFFVAGLVFPELRRWIEIRRYERELNRLVARTDAEIRRIDLGYLLRDDLALAPASTPGRPPETDRRAGG
jgi:hypothetical protein